MEATKAMEMLKIKTAIELTKSDSLPAEILPGLFLGSVGCAYNKASLEEAQITHILTVADNLQPRYRNDFTYKIIQCHDNSTQDLLDLFNLAFDFINETLSNNKRILVHCFAGKSRSTTFVIAYLIRFQQMKLKEALMHVLRIRPSVMPNQNFMEQLRSFEMKELNLVETTCPASVLESKFDLVIEKLKQQNHTN